MPKTRQKTLFPYKKNVFQKVVFYKGEYGGLYVPHKIFSLFHKREELRKYFLMITHAICLFSVIAHPICLFSMITNAMVAHVICLFVMIAHAICLFFHDNTCYLSFRRDTIYYLSFFHDNTCYLSFFP